MGPQPNGVCISDVQSLNLQAWRIPLWVYRASNPNIVAFWSQPPSLENPFVGAYTKLSEEDQSVCLNLQAWRIPLWATDTPFLTMCGRTVSTSKPGESLCGLMKQKRTIDTFLLSQPPSLENPFVGEIPRDYRSGPGIVSTSKPGESLCGKKKRKVFFNRERESQPPSLENPFVGDFLNHEDMTETVGLNLQAWRIPLWVLPA